MTGLEYRHSKFASPHVLPDIQYSTFDIRYSVFCVLYYPHMHISEHYSDYPEKTLIVVTNNDMAKILHAYEREVEEKEVLMVDTESPKDRSSGTANSAPPDTDAMKAHARRELYKELSDKLMLLLKKGYKQIILCAPEACKHEIADAMHTDVKLAVTAVVPKNLASLPLDQVIRILQETPRE